MARSRDWWHVQQIRALFDERRAEVARDERRVIQHRTQERDVRGDAADAELREGALGPCDGRREVAGSARQLREHRVEVRADLRARRRRAAVEADAGATRRAVRRDAPGVGPEALRRVFGRDAALQRGAPQHDVLLVEPEVGEGLSCGDAHLRLHEVDVGDFFGDGVLDLDAGVHLDEHVLAGALAGGVHQELDGARVDVADRFGEGDSIPMQGRAQFVGDVRRRRDLDDLLVAALHGAVPLEQVHGVTGRIGEDLHLDVTGTNHGLLEEHACVAEGRAGLAHGLGDGRGQLRGLLDAAHAASAAAGDGLHEDREADVGGLGDELVDVLGRLGRAEHRDTRGDRVAASR